jgi:hypothetical protein
MTDGTISLQEFVEGFLIDVEARLRAHELDNSAVAFIVRNWLGEMCDDARAGSAADVARWVKLINAKIEVGITPHATFEDALAALCGDGSRGERAQ